MMSKWKTIQRGKQKPVFSESSRVSSEKSYEDTALDGSTLGFLDDMLASGTFKSRREVSRPVARRGSRSPPLPPKDSEYVDHIIDLAAFPGEDVSHRGSSTNSSGYSSHSSQLLPRPRSREQREPRQPTSPYASISKRSSLRPLSRYGSGGSSSWPQSTDRERDPSGSDHTFYRSGREPSRSCEFDNQRVATRNKSRDRSPRPTLNMTNLRNDGYKVSYSDYEDDNVDHDHVMPIPVFQVNADDEDTISCLTTSVSSHYDMETRSGSFPWSRRSQKSAPSVGEYSNADTLDDIAEMLHPNQNGRANALLPRAGVNSKYPSSKNDFFRPPPPPVANALSSLDVVFGSNQQCGKSDDAPTLSPEEIYRGTKAPKRLSQHHSWMSFGEPLLSQVRLLFRYWISLILPRHWRRKGGKNGDGQGYLGTWNSSNDPKVGPQSLIKRQQPCGGNALLLAFFLGFILIPLGIRHGPTIKSRAMGRIRAATKSRRRDKNIGKDIHGGMSKRSDRDPVVQNNGQVIAGKMAQHSPHVPSNGDAFSVLDSSAIELPTEFDVLADVTDLPVQKGVDAPFYWHIPRSGGGTVNDIFGGCLSLTLASDAGSIGVSGSENKLKVVKISKRFSYVNVDTSSPAGIERAKRLDLIGSGMADITVSSLLYQALSLFSRRRRGRLFTVIRHPVERAVSLFHYLQDTQWRRRQSYRKELTDLSIDEYFESGLAENNWMTRFLINEPTKGVLTNDDLLLAKEVLRRKCLVGLLKDKAESFARFEKYFGFPLQYDDQKECQEKKLQWAWPQKHRHEEVEENTPTWDLIVAHNVHDMELYHYASEVLFVEQAAMFS